MPQILDLDWAGRLNRTRRAAGAKPRVARQSANYDEQELLPNLFHGC
jgi:hypothetical protein